MYYNLVWLRPGSYLNYNISPPNYQKLIMCYTLVVTPPLLGCVGCVGYSICNMFPLITCMHPSCMYPILAQACVRMCLCIFFPPSSLNYRGTFSQEFHRGNGMQEGDARGAYTQNICCLSSLRLRLPGRPRLGRSMSF